MAVTSSAQRSRARDVVARLRAQLTPKRMSAILIVSAMLSVGIAAFSGVYESVRKDYLLRMSTAAFDTSTADDAAGEEIVTVPAVMMTTDADEVRGGADGGADDGVNEAVMGAEGGGGGGGGEGGDDVEDTVEVSRLPTVVGVAAPRKSSSSKAAEVKGGGSGLGPRLPHVSIRGDKLTCKCGGGGGAVGGCASYDYPDVAYVLPDIKTTAAAIQALETIHHRSIDSPFGESVEVIMREWPGVDRDAVVAAAKRLSSEGGGAGGGGGDGGTGLRSYRGEPLERVSIVVTDAEATEARSTLAMASGAFANTVSIVRSSDLPPRAALGTSTAARAWPLPQAVSKTAVVDKLLTASVTASPGSSSSPPDVSFAMQYFRRPGLVKKIGDILAGYHTKHGLSVEVLINDDSASEVKEWGEALKDIPHYIVIQGNVHEIRGYNRLAMMSRAELVAVIQDDDLPPATPDWLLQARDLQAEHPNLGLIAGMVGQVQGGPDTGRWGKARGRHVKQIPYADSKGRPFMFVSWANIGPFLLRRSIFLKAGMFHTSFSCRGDPGIGFDYEYGIRLWKKKYEVGLTIMQFRYHQGSSRSSGTRASSGAKQRRDAIEKRNTALIHQMYRGFYVNHAPGGANKSPAAKAMSLNSVCTAARLPTLANMRLKGNKVNKGWGRG